MIGVKIVVVRFLCPLKYHTGDTEYDGDINIGVMPYWNQKAKNMLLTEKG